MGLELGARSVGKSGLEGVKVSANLNGGLIKRTGKVSGLVDFWSRESKIHSVVLDTPEYRDTKSTNSIAVSRVRKSSTSTTELPKDLGKEVCEELRTDGDHRGMNDRQAEN